MTHTTAPDTADRDEYADAIAAVVRVSAASYGSGESPLDDASFELLVSLIQAYEAHYPEHTDRVDGDGAAGPSAPRPLGAGIEVLGEEDFAPRGAAALSA
ncbi:hypothetical protein AB0D46_23355 [Streptomyces sp. NPDC048383]|uniref:hypothetical protein n=1 Tax=Streptomyces sp. NPDC048383 TaxID=3155386 RepID=UPI003437E2DD